METNRVLKLLLYKIDSGYFKFMKITEEGSTICKIINMIQDIDRVIYNSFASLAHGINTGPNIFIVLIMLPSDRWISTQISSLIA